MSERVAIVGSRKYADLDAVRAYVDALPINVAVISGLAEGVDLVAISAAINRGMIGVEVPVHNEAYRRLGKGAYFARNAVIAELCTRMVAFWDGESRGTAHAIECAKKLGKPVEVRR